jgi:hypothetical protein
MRDEPSGCRLEKERGRHAPNSSALRAALGGAAIAAFLVVSPAARAQGVPVFPLPPVPLPLPPPTSNYGGTMPPAASAAPTTSSPATAATPVWPPPKIAASTPADVEALSLSRKHEVWAGWETATADATAVGVILIGAVYHDVGAALPVSAFIYALAPPVIHVLRGHAGKGLASLAVRLLGPALGFGLGASFGGTPVTLSSGRFTTDEGVGVGLGAACAAALDAGVLGWDRWEGSRVATHVFAYNLSF